MCVCVRALFQRKQTAACVSERSAGVMVRLLSFRTPQSWVGWLVGGRRRSRAARQRAVYGFFAVLYCIPPSMEYTAIR
jgi:hypothetical protein